METFSFHGLVQINKVLNNFGRMLDLVPQRSDSNSFEALQDDLPIVKCDAYHPSLNIIVKLFGGVNFDDSADTYYDFKNSDFLNIEEQLVSVDWAGVLSNLSVNEAFLNFHNLFSDIVKCFTPKKKVYSSIYPWWFTPELKSLVKNNIVLHNRYRSLREASDYQAFKNF